MQNNHPSTKIKIPSIIDAITSKGKTTNKKTLNEFSNLFKNSFDTILWSSIDRIVIPTRVLKIKITKRLVKRNNSKRGLLVRLVEEK